jgi:hypothetical protein
MQRVIAEVLDAETDLDRATDMIADRLAVLAITGDQLVLGADTIASPPMGQFLWNVFPAILAALAGAALGVVFTHRAMKPQVIAAENRARAEQEDAAARRRKASQERAECSRQLSMAREDHSKARDAYHRAESRFELARLFGQLREFICVLRHQPEFDTVHENTTGVLDGFESARSHVERYDPTLATMLTTSRRELELVLYPERGSSAATAAEGIAVVAALQRSAIQTAAQVDIWIEQRQPTAPVD